VYVSQPPAKAVPCGALDMRHPLQRGYQTCGTPYNGGTRHAAPPTTGVPGGLHITLLSITVPNRHWTALQEMLGKRSCAGTSLSWRRDW
jgi:hypothetical protein